MLERMMRNTMNADEIKQLRAALGMTAKEFGNAIGVTENTVFRWEMGLRFPSGAAVNVMLRMAKDKRIAVSTVSV
jgi:DNA-binding transcriptional regulator YiaG